MLDLSTIEKTEKNKLASGSVWLVMLEINIPSVAEPIRIVSNNQDVVWNSETWQRFPFDIDEQSETASAETAQFQIRVSNVNNVIGQYLREYETWVKVNGFSPITCTLYIINNNDLANLTPAFSRNLVLNSSNITFLEATFTVSARDMFRARTPKYRMFPNSCRFAFKSTECAYAGTELACDKTLARCKELQNSSRYGGFPTIGNAGVSL